VWVENHLCKPCSTHFNAALFALLEAGRPYQMNNNEHASSYRIAEAAVNHNSRKAGNNDNDFDGPYIDPFGYAEWTD
jgi:hypothetical protein